VTIRARFLLEPGRPLDSWRRALDQDRPEHRDMLRQAIGKMASRPVQHRSYVVRDHLAAFDRLEDGELLYFDPTARCWYLRREEPIHAWTAAHLHPELSAQVWARARARVARAALRVPLPDLLRIEGDALWVTHDPRWPDDGKPGTFRVKA
jgi:hypothetical protein